MKSAFSVLFGLLLAVSAGFVFIHSGIYNIAASRPHPGPVRWLMTTITDNSVRFHAAGIAVPPLSRQNRRRGFQHFENLCADCHGTPGSLPSEVGIGLSPEPPPLAVRAESRSPAELFWITEHGLKFRGMPGFGKSRTGEDLWSIVAFVQELSSLSGEDYRQLKKSLNTGPSGDPYRDSGRRDAPPDILRPPMILHQVI